MRVTIVRDDSAVGVDGRFFRIDLSDFPPEIHAVQWNGAAGHVEYNDGRGNEPISDLAPFETWRLRWIAARDAADAPPPPPPPPTQDQLDAAEARAYPKLQALRAMTPAEVQAWCAANITDLPSAKDALTTLAIAVGILARRL